MLLDAFGCFWMLLDAFGCFWMLLDAFGCFWMLLDAFGCFWILLVLIAGHLGSSPGLAMAKSWSFQARSSTTILHDGLDMELMTEAGQLLHRDDSTSCFNSYGSQHFQFNNKNCCGTMFHVNVLENKAGAGSYWSSL